MTGAASADGTGYVHAQLVGPDGVLDLSPDDVELLMLAIENDLEALGDDLDDGLDGDAEAYARIETYAGELGELRDRMLPIVRL